MIQACMIGAIVVYLVGMIYVGYYYSKKGGGFTANEFYLGGRKLGPLVTAMSAEASDMSSWLLMGLPGVAYLSGIAEAGWTAIGLAVGTYFNWLIVAKRLRRYTIVAGNSFTIPEFFSRRYRDDRHILTCIAAIVILVFFVPYTASGFKAVGTLFNSLFQVEYHVAMLIGAVVIIGYTVLGGFLAVSTTDLIQSIVMTLALIMIVLFGVNVAGGWQAVMDNASALPGYLNMTLSYNVATGGSSPYSLLTIFSTLAWGLGYFGMPHILLRFMAIREEKMLTTSRRIASIWVCISMFVAIVIGIIGYSVSLTGKVPLFTTSSDSETIIIQLANLLSQNGAFFAILAGVVLAGILASTMSTADSQLLTAASSVSQNLLQEVFHMKLSPKKSLWIARLTVVAVAAVGILLAWNPNSSVFAIVAFAWAGFGASFGPVVLFALFWKRSNLWGALAGMISGGAMVFIWKYVLAPLGGAFAIYELLPAFLVACVAIVVVSLLTAKPSKEICDEFDRVREGKLSA